MSNQHNGGRYCVVRPVRGDALEPAVSPRAYVLIKPHTRLGSARENRKLIQDIGLLKQTAIMFLKIGERPQFIEGDKWWESAPAPAAPQLKPQLRRRPKK